MTLCQWPRSYEINRNRWIISMSWAVLVDWAGLIGLKLLSEFTKNCYWKLPQGSRFIFATKSLKVQQKVAAFGLEQRRGSVGQHDEHDIWVFVGVSEGIHLVRLDDLKGVWIVVIAVDSARGKHRADYFRRFLWRWRRLRCFLGLLVDVQAADFASQNLCIDEWLTSGEGERGYCYWVTQRRAWRWLSHGAFEAFLGILFLTFELRLQRRWVDGFRKLSVVIQHLNATPSQWVHHLQFSGVSSWHQSIFSDFCQLLLHAVQLGKDTLKVFHIQLGIATRISEDCNQVVQIRDYGVIGKWED